MNVTYNEKAGTLTIILPCSKLDAARVSASGKSRILATSGGNVGVAVLMEGKPVTVKVGVNAYVAA